VIGVPSARLFGRHVADRAQHDARGRAGGLRRPAIVRPRAASAWRA
jgi:hypothetical protein